MSNEIKLGEAISCMESLHGTLNDYDNDCLRVLLDMAALSQSEPAEGSQGAINIVADWPPCNPACEYEDPHSGIHDFRNASCSCDVAKCSIAKQNLKSEPVQVSQPVKTFHGHIVSDEPVRITKESWDNACGGLGASK